MVPKLTVRGLGKDYPGRGGEASIRVLDHIDFEVPTGAFVSVVGLNGSGKTTLLRIIAGLESASRGEVSIDNRKIDDGRRNIGMVFQGVALLPWRTTLENIEIGLEIRGMPTQERRDLATNYIRAFGLAGFESMYPGELSGGMCQKVAIARALITNPDLVLMDEPFSALDCRTRNQLQSFLPEVWQQRRDTILFVTHDVEEAVLLSDAIVVISQRPSRVLEIVPVDLPRPRDRTDVRNNDLRRHVLQLMCHKSHASSMSNTFR